MKETYEELLKRHESERLACRERERKENMTVTLQCSNLGGSEEDAYSIEIIFPQNLSHRTKAEVNIKLHELLKERWLEEMGYTFQWLQPKDHEAWERRQKEKEEGQFR